LLVSKCLNFDSCSIMSPKPALLTFVVRYWVTSAELGFVPLTFTLMVALALLASARTVSVPPLFAIAAFASHLLSGVVSLPDFVKVRHCNREKDPATLAFLALLNQRYPADPNTSCDHRALVRGPFVFKINPDELPQREV